MAERSADGVGLLRGQRPEARGHDVVERGRAVKLVEQAHFFVGRERRAAPARRLGEAFDQAEVDPYSMSRDAEHAVARRRTEHVGELVSHHRLREGLVVEVDLVAPRLGDIGVARAHERLLLRRRSLNR